jgi:hypothetical protein
MEPTRIVDSSWEELNSRTNIFIGSCGYETRSSALAPRLAKQIRHRYALAYVENNHVLARSENEQVYRSCGFELPSAHGTTSKEIRSVLDNGLEIAKDTSSALAIDVSSMTRTWHGAIIQTLMEKNWQHEVETYFAYVPSRFEPPPSQNPPNQVIGPVSGFGSLSLPDLPIALILSLGYEKERALGFMEMLDPSTTVLMLARAVGGDKFLRAVRENNGEIIARTLPRWVFEYPLLEPSATYRLMESISGGLEFSHRIVLASLGPKIFGILCLLLAASKRSISVWQMSSGIHIRPRDVFPDGEKVIVLKVVWSPAKLRY